MGRRKSGKNAYILLTAPDGSSIELSGLATDGRSRSNQFAIEFDFSTQRAGGFEQDWLEAVPTGSSLWQAGVFAFYNSADDEIEDFLLEMHEAQHAPADCTDAGEYTLEIAPEGECEGKSRYTLSNAVLLRLDMPALPGNIMRIGALFGGWQSTRETIGGVFAATSLGLYWSSPFYFDEREVKWTRLGQLLGIQHFAADRDHPRDCQLATVGSRGDSEVWIRRPSVSDDWQLLLNLDQAWEMIEYPTFPLSSEFRGVASRYGVIYIAYSNQSDDNWLLYSDNYGGGWNLVDLDTQKPIWECDVDTEGNVIISSRYRGIAVGALFRFDGTTLTLIWNSDSAGSWEPDFYIDGATIYAGLYDEDPGNPRLVSSAAGLGIIDTEDCKAGVIGSNKGGIWASGNTLRTVRSRNIYISDDGAANWNCGEIISEGVFRAIDGLSGPRLVLGRYTAKESAPHLVYSTVDDGETLREKGGPHAGQEDGGGDSIPYSAVIAYNGIHIV